MFRLNLLLRRKSDDIMILSPAPWFRLLFAGLAAVIVIGIFTVAGDRGEAGTAAANDLGPLIIIILCIAGALYEESWAFDRRKRIIIHKYGLTFLNRKKIFSFAEILNIELKIFLRGAESDGKADHRIDIGRPFAGNNTEMISGRRPGIIHPKYHQELVLNMKSADPERVESLDSRGTAALETKAKTISDFSGISFQK